MRSLADTIAIMDENEPIVIVSRITEQRKWDRYDHELKDPDPLTEEENSLLDHLISIVEKKGTVSALSEDQLKIYEDLGARRNLIESQRRKYLLPNAIEPWVTQ
jgi:hypothetical protein